MVYYLVQNQEGELLMRVVYYLGYSKEDELELGVM